MPVEEAADIAVFEAQNRQLAGYVSDHRYYSVGALHRLPLTEEFFAPQENRDSRSRRRVELPAAARPLCDEWEEFEWLPGALEAFGCCKEPVIGSWWLQIRRALRAAP